MATERVPLIIDSDGAVKQLPLVDRTKHMLDSLGNSDVNSYDQIGRLLLTSNLTPVAASLYTHYFTAFKSFTITSLSIGVTTAVIGGTTTLVRMGIHDLQAGNVNLNSLLAGTTNDITLLDSTGVKTKALSTPVSVVRGTRYALSFLATNSVAWSTAPQIRAQGLNSTLTNLTPVMSKLVTAQTDLPSGNLTVGGNNGSMIWYRFT